MLARSDTAWGIDLGHQALKAVKLVRQGGTVRVESVQRIPYEAVDPDPDSVERSRHIRTALAEFISIARPRKHDKVAVAIPGRSAFNRTIPLPPVEEKRIPDIVKYEAQQLIPFPIDEVIWDYQRLSQGEIEELEVTLFAVKTQIIFSHLSSLQAANVPIDVIQVAPLALYNFVQFDRKPEGSMIVVDIGAGNADLVLVDGERFWNRPLPYSGDDITQALEEKFQISFEEAEDLKVNSGTSKQADKLFNVMRPVLGDMVSEIHRSIGYYKSQTRNVKFDKMVLMGNAFKLKGMKEFFAQHLDYSVEMLDRLEGIQMGANLDAESLQADLGSYGVALGLALQALNVGPIQINMLPKEERLSKIINKKKPYGIAVAAILALMIGASLYSHTKRGQELEQSLKIAPKIIQTVRKDDETYQAILAEANAPKSQIDKIVGIGLGRDYWPLVLNQLFKALPEKDCLLVALDAGGPGPAVVNVPQPSQPRDNLPMKLVIDILHPANVEKYEIIKQVTSKGGIEDTLKKMPLFENVTRKTPESVSVKVGLLRERKPGEKKKEEGKTDEAAGGAAPAAEGPSKTEAVPPPAAGGAPPPRGGRPLPRGVAGGRPGPVKTPAPAPAPGAEEEKKEKEDGETTEELYKDTLQFLRFTYTWTVKSQDKLHGSKDWWIMVVDLVRTTVEKGKDGDAMDLLWNFQATSPDFANDEAVKKDVVAELRKLEPKLKDLPQYEKCTALLKRLDPTWKPEAHAGVSSPPSAAAN
jgi:type IV pilus assembly protein PilM